MKAGFIGLGAMGMHMARNLHRAQLLAGVWNRSDAKAAALAAELETTHFATPAALAESCDAIVICVSADDDLRSVIGAILGTAKPGAIVIDCSTVSASTARETSALLAARSAEFLDCPVSGGVEGARLASLAIMAGGERAAFDRAQPILQAMGRTITYFGKSGAGQAAKATNQIMCAGIIQVVAEAMMFAKSQGLPLDALIDTLGKGAGSSWYFVNRAPFMAQENFPAGFRVSLHAKDLRICRDMAAQRGGRLPVTESVLEQYGELMTAGFGDEDISAIFRLAAKLFPESSPAARSSPE